MPEDRSSAVPVFPSREWLDAFCEQVSRHPEAGAMAAALDGVYRFVIAPGDGLTDQHVYDVAIAPDDGGAQVRPHTQADAARVTITAPYGRWVQLLRGELDLRMAVLLGRVRLSGDVPALLSNVDKTRPLLDALSAVDSQFLSGGGGAR